MLVLIIEKEVFCQTFVHKSLSSPEWNSGRLSQKAKAFSSGVFSGVWTSFTREKRFKSRLFVRSELKNYPVDDFWRYPLEAARDSRCRFRANLKVPFSRRSLAFGFARRVEPEHNSRCWFCANLKVSFSRRSLASGCARRVEPARYFSLWCSAMRQF